MRKLLEILLEIQLILIYFSGKVFEMGEINSCLKLANYNFIIGKRIIIGEISERITLRYDLLLCNLQYVASI